MKLSDLGEYSVQKPATGGSFSIDQRNVPMSSFDSAQSALAKSQAIRDNAFKTPLNYFQEGNSQGAADFAKGALKQGVRDISLAGAQNAGPVGAQIMADAKAKGGGAAKFASAIEGLDEVTAPSNPAEAQGAGLTTAAELIAPVGGTTKASPFLGGAIEKAGQVVKNVGESLYKFLIPRSTKEAQMLQAYKAKVPATERLKMAFSSPTGKEGVSAQRADTSGPFEGTLYHGTHKGNDFSEFDLGKAQSGNRGARIYLTESPVAAEYFSKEANQANEFAKGTRFPKFESGDVLEFKLKPGAKIKRLDAMPQHAEAEKILAALEKEGYDGVSFPDDVLNHVEGIDISGAFKDGKPARTTIVFNPKAVTRSSPSIPKELEPLAAGVKPPRTMADTAFSLGIKGTEGEMGVQATRASKKIWDEVIGPALKTAEKDVDMQVFLDDVGREIADETADLSRRNALLEALAALKEDYKDVGKISLEKLQDIKSDWAQFIPEKYYQGKPIAGAFKDVTAKAADKARRAIYDTLGDDVKEAYIDYGNLQGLRELGQKAMTGGRLKGGFGGFWSAIKDMALTPVATIGGRVLYRTGEGIEFIGEQGAKTLMDLEFFKSLAPQQDDTQPTPEVPSAQWNPYDL